MLFCLFLDTSIADKRSSAAGFLHREVIQLRARDKRSLVALIAQVERTEIGITYGRLIMRGKTKPQTGITG